jgi:predicted metalloprotease with PDZ domain
VTSTQDIDSDAINHRTSRFELKPYPSLDLSISTKSSHFEIFHLTHPDESSKEEPLKAKLCYLSKSKDYDGLGLVLIFQQHLHVIVKVEESSPSYQAGLCENDVIIFVGKTNVEKLTHEDVKVMMQAMILAANQVELTVLSKSDIPKYKTLQEKGLIDWSIMGLER